MATIKKNSLDLGALQSNLESATKNHKAAQSAATRAIELASKAENEYVIAQKALAAGVAQLTAATKVV